MGDAVNRRIVGYFLLGGAAVVAALAVLFRTEVIADPGTARNTVALILAGVAAADAAIGIALILRS